MAKDLNPFDFVKAVSETKEQIITDNYTEGGYVPFIVNRALSLFDDSIFAVNMMNFHHNIDPKLQFDYLLHSLRKKRRFKKWPWKKVAENADVDLICQLYKYNRKNAEQALRVLSKEQLEILKKQQEKGGVTNDRKPGRN